MKITLLNPVLETDDGTLTLDGYNMSHRFAPLHGYKYVLSPMARVYDPVTGRNYDRIVLTPFSDSYLVDKMEGILQEKIRLNKEEFEKKLKLEKQEYADKLEKKEERIKEIKESAEIRLAQNKETVRKDFESQLKMYENKVKFLEKQLEQAESAQIEIVDDTMNGATTAIQIPLKKKKK